MKKLEGRMSAFGKQHQRVMNRAANASKRFSGGLANIAKAYVGIQGVRVLARGVGRVITLNREFEKTIDGVTAKFGGLTEIGTGGLERLQETAKEVGRTTEFTAQQAAEGLEFLAMAGFDAERSMASLPAVVNLATAAGVDLARATDIATDTLGAFGMITEDAAEQAGYLARVNDVMAKTVTTSNTDMERLFETFVKSAPQATALGQSIETVSALAGKLASAGLKAADSGTAMRNMMLRLSAPTGAAADSLKAIGVDAFDAEGNFRDVIDIIQDLETGTEKLTEAEKSKHLSNIFGARTISAVNLLLQEGAGSLKEYRTELQGSAGAADDMAAIMRDNLDGSIKGLQSRIQSIILGSGSDFTLLLKEQIDQIIHWMDELGGAEKIGKALATALGGLAKTVLTIIKVLSAAPGLFKGIIIGLAVMKVAMIAFNIVAAANPIGLIILGAVAAVAVFTIAIQKIIQHWGAIKSAADATWSAIRAGLLTAADLVLTVWGNALKGIIQLMSRVGGALGIDTSRLDGAVEKITALQESVRAGSFIGGVEAAPTAAGRAQARANEERYSGGRVDIAITNNSDARVRARATERVPLQVNTARQGYNPYGTR